VVFVRSESADETRVADATGPDPDVVLRSALRAALHSVQGVCEQLFAELAAQRSESRDAAAAAAEQLAAIQAEAQSTIQRGRLETQLEVTELRREVERLRHDLERPVAVGFDQHDARPSATPSALGGIVALTDPADAQRQIDVLQQALALSRSDCEEVNRRLEEEKQKHARLVEAVRSMGNKGAVFTLVPAAPDDAGTALHVS
jgi:chromosome segregation ATPase